MHCPGNLGLPGPGNRGKSSTSGHEALTSQKGYVRIRLAGRTGDGYEHVYTQSRPRYREVLLIKKQTMNNSVIYNKLISSA